MLRTLPLFLLPLLAQAHDGHGVPGVSHWHASDAFGYVVLAMAIGLVWWARRK
jgi:hypothetical protein